MRRSRRATAGLSPARFDPSTPARYWTDSSLATASEGVQAEPRSAPAAVVASDASAADPLATTNWRGLYALYTVVLFDLMAVGLIVPLIAPFMKELGATPKFIGFLSSLYGGIQLFSGPALGTLSDRMSRRDVHIVCTLGGALGYLMLGLANSIWMALASRIVVGIFRQTMTISKAVLADLSLPEDRSAALGYIYTAISLGFVVGPMTGGILADKFGTKVPILLGVVLFVANAQLIAFLIPQKLGLNGLGGLGLGAPTAAEEVAAAAAADAAKPSLLAAKLGTGTGGRSAGCEPPRATGFASLRPAVRNLMVLRFFIGCSVMLSRNSMGLLMEYGPTQLTKSEKGLVFSFFGVISIVANTVIVPYLVKRVHEKQMSIVAALLMGGGQVLMAVANSLNLFGAALAVIAVSSSVLKVSMHSILTKAVDGGRYGEVLGVADSTFSICRTGAPLVAGVMTEYGGPAVPGFVGGCFSVVVAGLCTFMIVTPPAPARPKVD